MTQEHPITPPAALLVEQWSEEWRNSNWIGKETYIATQAARWGADQRSAVNEAELQKARDEELEACLKHMCRRGFSDADILHLRTARRPKPPSLKEQALEQLDSLHADLKMHGFGTNTDTIRRALEQLDG